MNTNSLDTIVKCMPPHGSDSNIQRVQTEHRLKLTDFWDITEGSRVLEIGCGQGDTTAVLAYLVGETGFVHGIDIASPNYGSPVTLGDSIDFIKSSKLGKRIHVDFETDILSPKFDFTENSFDFIVLSHCSWYLKSSEEFLNILKKINKWGKTLCFAEWDTRVTTSEQIPHFLSVLTQAQYECFKEDSNLNVRTLFTPKDIQILTESAGWQIVSEKTIDSSHLQDGRWEVEQTLSNYQLDLSLPTKFNELIQSQISLLEAAINTTTIKSMSTYSFLAK